MRTSPESLGALWKAAVANPNLLGKLSEEIIERFYRSWVSEGDSVLDLGANVGRHFFPLAECVGETGRLAGFEPIPSLAASIKDKIEKKGLGANITIAQKAMSDQPGRATFFEVSNAQALSGLRQRDDLNADMKVNEFETEITTVDTFAALATLRFIKIDVEGAEFNVFKGARQALLRGGPVVAFEDGRGRSGALYEYSVEQFHAFFESIDYELLDIFGFVRTAEMAKYPGPWNYFAVPRNKVDEVTPIIILANMIEIWNSLPPK